MVIFLPIFHFTADVRHKRAPISGNYSNEPFLKFRKHNTCAHRGDGGLKIEAFSEKRARTMSHGNGAGDPNLLGEALLGLNLVMLLCRHPADAGWGCSRQRLHLLDGFHGDTLGKHAEEWRHIHDDTLLVRVRHRQIWGAEKCVIKWKRMQHFWRFEEGWLRICCAAMSLCGPMTQIARECLTKEKVSPIQVRPSEV